jgi:hypothetical protein
MTPFDIQRCVQIAERTVLVPPPGNCSDSYYELRYDRAQVLKLLADQRAMIAQIFKELNPTVEKVGLTQMVEKLEQVRVSHCDWTGYLVHRTDVTQSVLEYDEHCPACVIDAILFEAARQRKELNPVVEE